MKKKTKLFIIFILLLILICIFLFSKNNLNEYINVSNIKSFILSFGALGPLVAVILCILTCIATFIPGFLIVFSLSAIYGFEYSVLITMIGYTLGSSICFYLAKYLGRDFVLRFSTKSSLQKLDDFLKTEGFLSILISRLLPFIPYNLTSYLAGLTSIPFKSFLFGTIIGQIPGAVAYAYIGKLLTGSEKSIFIGITSFLALIALTIILKRKYYK